MMPRTNVEIAFQDSPQASSDLACPPQDTAQIHFTAASVQSGLYFDVGDR